MNKQKLSIIATLAIIASISTIGIASIDSRVRADIPFDFYVGGKEFKAGEYSVSRLQGNNSTTVLVISNRESYGTANFNVNNVTDRTDKGARLVFNRYGNQYFLAQIFDGSPQGAQLLKSKAEREAAKKRDIITQEIIEPEIMTVLAKSGR